MISIAPQALASDLLPPQNNFLRRIDHVPLWVILNIAAWNYSLIIPLNVIVPALLAGNVILLKHSALTPLCGQAFEKAFGNLSVPHLVTNLIISHEDTARLIQDPRIQHVAFTGSVEGGHRVYQAAAATRFL